MVALDIQARLAKDTVKSKADTSHWSSAPFISTGMGLLVLSIANEGGRLSQNWGDPTFWCGLLLIFVPGAYRLLSTAPERTERIVIILTLGGAFYLTKLLSYPLSFTYPDELQHLITAIDIFQTGHLFKVNPLLPISAWYPGLEITVNAVTSLTGLSIFWSGVIIIGIAKILVVLGLFLFFEAISHSSRIGGLSALLYMTNQMFLITDSQFAYESLGLAITSVIFCDLFGFWVAHCDTPYNILCLGSNIESVVYYLVSISTIPRCWPWANTYYSFGIRIVSYLAHLYW
jgi:hypothetical protein